MNVFDLPGDPGGHETITPGDTATGISSGLLTGSGNQPAKAALISVEDYPVNVTLDGTTPTQTGGTNVGHQLSDLEYLVIRGVDAVKNFSCIDRTSGNTATVKITVFY